MIFSHISRWGGIFFLSTRLFNQYKNSQLSFTELPNLDPYEQRILDSTPAEDLVVETMPTGARA
ncbi:MAG: hypothetical protein ACKVKR_02710 [Pseudomonadales bacterium]